MVEKVELTLNGHRHEVETDAERSLLEVLREDLGLTGTKYGCGLGDCHACTVLLDGKPVQSCRTPLRSVAERGVKTIEGLAGDGALHPVQQAFLEAGAMQCGYCVPGMILATVALLEETPDPDRQDVVDALNGHLCRCCGYPRILEAVLLAARRLNAQGAER